MTGQGHADFKVTDRLITYLYTEDSLVMAEGSLAIVEESSILVSGLVGTAVACRPHLTSNFGNIPIK